MYALEPSRFLILFPSPIAILDINSHLLCIVVGIINHSRQSVPSCVTSIATPAFSTAIPASKRSSVPARYIILRLLHQPREAKTFNTIAIWPNYSHDE
jgi:hypothetical protein